ncbi:acetyltransferase (GNAT) family protein [Haloactinopolyspora alba]|uniref:Acetyltransferase (GNAT) family protein n=1 Tax=Haloactinopolyspora alba TaxID=648780 RepID=A0A2P8DV45_9ACTN|nr:GNAT family N-acetyltransferase [Haloactinopolyspora alba]PSL01109.1 acetyltransferase (GNAT) family protein [Haloactinopolyspora alba]
MSEQPVADKSVRLAWAADTDAVGRVQARAWQHSYQELLPKELLDEVDSEQFAAAWSQAVIRPPTAQHRVLVALDAGRVVGFAATAPSDDPDAQPTDGEVVAFHIDPDELGEGHGSRLISAVADTLRADGFTRGRIWLFVGEDALRGFLEPAGWGPDSAHRTLDLTGDGEHTVRQVRLHTDLAEDAS